MDIQLFKSIFIQKFRLNDIRQALLSDLQRGAIRPSLLDNWSIAPTQNRQKTCIPTAYP